MSLFVSEQVRKINYVKRIFENRTIHKTRFAFKEFFRKKRQNKKIPQLFQHVRSLRSWNLDGALPQMEVISLKFNLLFAKAIIVNEIGVWGGGVTNPHYYFVMEPTVAKPHA